MNEIKFVLNGEPVVVSDDPTKRLLDILRGSFNLVGVKEGCGEGECGGCAVLIDHKITNSCITPLGSVIGKEVMTIEAFSQTSRGKALRKAFEDEGSVQCGICTPGMIIASESLLHANPNPTELEIRDGLSGNLCRCTGYNMIIKAIQAVVEKEGDLW
jgi:carbon-monoxide dehydrogenase small subunit